MLEFWLNEPIYNESIMHFRRTKTLSRIYRYKFTFVFLNLKCQDLRI